MLYRIDGVTLPDAARADFDRQVDRTVAVLRQQPGFVRADRFDKVGGPGEVNVVNVTVWEDQESIDGAAKAVQAMHEDSGFDPIMFRRDHGITGNTSLFALSASEAAG